MIAMYVSAIALVAAGAAIGIVAMVCLGIKRDDRPGGFPADADDRIARAARKMTCRCSRPWRLLLGGEPNDDLTSRLLGLKAAVSEAERDACPPFSNP